MSNSIDRTPLSEQFAKSAKDDPSRLLERRYAEFGNIGEKHLSAVNKQANQIEKNRMRKEVQETENRRYTEWVNAQVRKVSERTPIAPMKIGNAKTYLSPAQFKQIEEAGKSWLISDNKRLIEKIQSEVEQSRMKIAERTLDRLENRMSQSKDRSLDQSRGRYDE